MGSPIKKNVLGSAFGRGPNISAVHNTKKRESSMPPKKEPMGTYVFYSMYEKKRVEVDPATVVVNTKTSTTKTGKTVTRYQAVGEDSQGRLLYKFVGAKDLHNYQ